MSDSKDTSQKNKTIEKPQAELVLNEDYYINANGLYVFTEKYLLKRGYCCKNICLHCPYEFKRNK